ncbi:hypothetical protein [Pedobacter metabolipauper]|uniref:Uncharacterized protein n=1 Tax=Pedobacter metabolipauper TaxID=425513 RepID=A0A4R6STI4_9SPHI|nr:hypothetical protein [Pedobacter metabolipauper]TDQ08233.1 hypothetical protein ATK78_2741 [Pedobacter metabolipauper]
MKNIIIVALILLATACKAQEPIAAGNATKIKSSGLTFSVERTTTELGNEFINIINLNNKLSKTKQVTPNLMQGVEVVHYIKYDKAILTKICANAISLNTLKKIPKDGSYDKLLIMIKYDTQGYPLEMQYTINPKSLMNADDFAEIEKGIKKSPFRVTFKKEIQRFIVGANYLNINVIITYKEMLESITDN